MIRTKFGVAIPPRKKINRGKCIVLEYILTGSIPSKKNRQRASFNYTWVKAQYQNFVKAFSGDIPRKEVLKFLMTLLKEIKPFIFKPTWIKEWEDKAITTLHEQCQSHKKSYKTLTFPIHSCQLNIVHYWADDRDRDNSNRAETIYDILVRGGLIIDDGYKCMHKNVSEAACYNGEILQHITQIYITSYKW